MSKSILGFDTQPYLLNVENGTLNLKTGVLGPHRRDDFLTKKCPVRYTEEARCPIWDEFLRHISGDDSSWVDYVQRIVGLALTGDVSEQKLFLFLGDGANGKTTLARTIQDLMGEDYAVQAAPDLLMVRRGDVHWTERADLKGCRLAICNEVEQGRELSEVALKLLTGGDKVKARRMRTDFFEFEPTHKLWLLGNHRPKVRGTDHGIWRRIVVVPFRVTITDDDRDRHLMEKLRGEREGILAWAVRGARGYLQDGLRPVESVVREVEQYREESDALGSFIEERCVTGPTARVGSSDIFTAFTAWLKAASEVAWSPQDFAQDLRRRGFEDSKSHGKKIWKGLGLRSDVSLYADSAANASTIGTRSVSSGNTGRLRSALNPRA